MDKKENTSYICDISYKIEKWKYDKLNYDDINLKIAELQKNKEFPANLRYIDSFSSPESSSGCAFQDVNTGNVIVGFAGTNRDVSTLDTISDLTFDVSIGLVGITPSSPYLAYANVFIKDLENKGYTVNQVTGHSLGGAQAVGVALENNIPSCVTYNSAPSYTRIPGDMIQFNIFLKPKREILKKFERYEGEIIRLTTNNDFLNNGSVLLLGLYPGESRIIIDNGGGHGIGAFLGGVTQDYISTILGQETDIFSVDANKDGKLDVTVQANSFVPKNLFSSGASLNGCPSVKLDPAAFSSLANNLLSLVNNEMSWISSAVEACITANNRLKTQKPQREQNLYEGIKNALNDHGLSSLLGSIDDSHGKLSSDGNKNTLNYLSSFNLGSIKFKKSEGRYEYTWYLDNHVMKANEIQSLASKVKNASRDLIALISSPTSIYNACGNIRIYNYGSVSKISESLVNVTNGFISKAQDAFYGTGSRCAFNDGIVQSVEEVLNVQKSNIDEIKRALTSLSHMAQTTASNFSNVDSALSSYINSGSSSGFQIQSVPQSYKAYLERSNVFDDVKDVLAAFDQQIEEASNDLALEVISDYNQPMQNVYNKFREIGGSLDSFRNALSAIEDKSSKTLERKKVRRHYHSPSMINADPPKPEYTYLGPLSNSLPGDLMFQVRNAIANILPLSDNFSSAMYYCNHYQKNIYDMHNTFKSLIEKAVYESYELDGLISAQNLISRMILRMRQELQSVSSQISSQFKGNSFDKYQTHISSAINLLDYFNTLIDDCFGVKMSTAA